MSELARRQAAAFRAAAPGTLVGLHRAVKERMEEVAAALPNFTMKNGEYRIPDVHHADLPPKVDDDAKLFPYIVVRPSRLGTDAIASADADSRATIDLAVGTYSDTDDGYLDMISIVDAIRLSVWSQPVLEGTAFEHVGPLTWDIPDPTKRPLWLGVVTTVWTLPRPHRVDRPQEG